MNEKPEQNMIDFRAYQALLKENEALTQRVNQIEQELWMAESRLQGVYTSREYKAAMLLRRFSDKLIPHGSRRRSAVKRAFKALRKLFHRSPGGIQGGKAQLETLLAYGKYARMDIVTTRHTMYVARLFKRELDCLSIECHIHIGEPQSYDDIPYIIICPQFVKTFPKVYFVMQMEQTVSSRWFTDEYIAILRNSCGVLDYSLTNIDFFQKPEYQDLSRLIYYLPIDYHPSYTTQTAAQEKEYDVLFYGDADNPRRKAVLDEAARRFKVKICTDLYGEDVYREIRKAKVLLNVHYYEGALLETTRLYETLSLNSAVIVSEDSRHATETDRLAPFVDFVSVDDTRLLLERIAYWVENDDAREEKVSRNQEELENRSNAFSFYFLRFLLAHDRIDFDTFYRMAGGYVRLGTDRVCLNLPESTRRRRAFDLDNHYGFVCVPGMRHLKGWVGCGMSYKLMMKKAQEEGLERLTICEDDVLFPQEFETRLKEIDSFLASRERWSVFSGVMADVGDVNVHFCETYAGREYVGVDRMISMVLNIYNREMFDILSQWNEQNRDVETNAVDRYLEGKKLDVYMQLPFLVGHKEELNSTIWGISNLQYSELIAASEKKLMEQAEAFKKR